EHKRFFDRATREQQDKLREFDALPRQQFDTLLSANMTNPLADVSISSEAPRVQPDDVGTNESHVPPYPGEPSPPPSIPSGVSEGASEPAGEEGEEFELGIRRGPRAKPPDHEIMMEEGPPTTRVVSTGFADVATP